ncbi:MAG: phenylalanine--tRNA ligase subunit beta [Clostridium sulfidigenes]|uniref:Phenylalanine--tRNA ligase beta subunit n=1 Tax=Clostridium sulfidigenes TaxID=318464 RepID=A0A927ZLE8_9CLOT|nr:phenylalanine--tRNA ligase subunit beta [Clostridium sulfidigenes]
MKYPVKWLKDYVDINVSPVELADALNLSGSHVEELILTGDEISNVVTGKITKIERHPDAEKLVVCAVDINKEEEIQIVTAATNMKEQDIIPVALHGATLHGGLKIKKGKLRGVVSNGMFCSEEELGIAGDEPVHGLMILPKDTPVGVDIKSVIPLESAIIDFEITSNRADCFSIIGMAREAAATLGLTYKMPNLKYSEEDKTNITDSYKVEIKSPLCRRYMAKGISNINIQPSPQWMQERLLEADVRPINNIVDITNFVMLELGQPLHAFDARDIVSNTIVVDTGKEGEKFVTLDEEERTIDSTMLCIKDGDKTIGLAGVMGGLNSEVKEDTSMIVLESANFNGLNIRNTSKKLGLRTEASTKFEKDLDPNLCKLAIDRVCALVEELGAGKVMTGVIDIYNEVKEPHTLEVDSNWVNRFLGSNISKEDMKRYLDGLDLNTEIKGDVLVVNCPTFRSDLNIKEDIAEEIARIHGYNNFESTLPHCEAIKSGKSDKHKLEDKIIEALVASGINQSISYSFVSNKIFDKLLIPQDSELRNVVEIRNPLGEDFKVMRTTTIASMMESLARNYVKSNESAMLFEIGKVYIKNTDEEKLPEERNILTLGMYGAGDYLELKGVVENVLNALGIDNGIFIRESENPSFHPGKTAALKLRNKISGILGEIHPDVSENYGIDTRCFVAELNLDMLMECAKIDKKHKALPKFPAVTRDIAVLVDDRVLVQEIEDTIKKQGGGILESAKLFDVYKGSQIPEGKKSIAYAITYRHADKTLTDTEVNKVHDKILRSLEHKLGAELR